MDRTPVSKSEGIEFNLEEGKSHFIYNGWKHYYEIKFSLHSKKV